MTQQVRSRRPSHPAALSLPRMTYAEFLEWNFENPHVEWVDGEVVMMAPVSGEHSDLGLFLLRVISKYVEVHELGVIRYEPFNMKTGPDLPGRSPDVMFVARKNLSRLKKTHLKGPADLTIEIVSAGSRRVDRGEKYYEYEQGGVKEYWLIDPGREAAEFYRLGRDKKYMLIEPGADGVFHSAILKGFWLNVEWLWRRPLPRVKDVLKQLGAE